MMSLYQVVLFVVKIAFKLLSRHKVYGLNHTFSGGAILAPNHVSFFDPPIVAISWPKEVHFLARSSLFTPRWFGAFIAALNTHPVSSSELASLKAVNHLLKEGKQVIIFPEGTRSPNGCLAAPRPGIGLLASSAKCAVIPVYIHGTYEMWGKQRKFPKLWGKTACVFGSPILYKDQETTDRRTAQKMIAEQVMKSIADLRTWYENGAKGSPP